jgi:hypothetical protein
MATAAFIAGLAPRIRSMPRCISRCWRWWLTRPWPQMTGNASLRPGSGATMSGAARDPPAYRHAGWRPNSFCRAIVVSPSAKKRKAVRAPAAYDRQLVEGVKRFQAAQGLGADGVIGQSTRDWLNVSPAQRAGVLALNIQRLRLLPGNCLPALWSIFRPIRWSITRMAAGAGLARDCRASGPQNADDEQRAE